MTRYFFNVHDGKTLIDDVGAVLAGITEARSYALKLAGDLLRDDPDFWNEYDWKMDVTDASGLTLFSLLFMAVDAPAVATAQFSRKRGS